MDRKRLESILERFPSLHISVFGDFFLDRYLEIDPELNELSIETGKTAYQVVGKRLQAGAAGTVCNNLAALEVGKIQAIGLIGDDGEGYDLSHALKQIGVLTNHLLISRARFTPTYTKPMLQYGTHEEEMNRQDIKNRTRFTKDLEDAVMQQLREEIPESHALIVADQVQERNCGVITDRIRDYLREMAEKHPRVLIFGDSRERIGEFRQVTLKPNRYEVQRAVSNEALEDVPTTLAIQYAQRLRERSGKPVYLTLDKEGICPVQGDKPVILPPPPVTGPIDIVGAGDSTTAGIVAALVAGADAREAAVVGNLVASITIRQIGTTGTATREQVIEAWEANAALYRPFFKS